MPISVVCKCGRTLTAPNEAAGKHGKCPSCGNRLLIAESEEPILLTEATPGLGLGFSASLGAVKCSYSRLDFSFHVEKDGVAYLQVIAKSDYGDDDDDSQLVLMRLDDERYEQLVQAMKTVQDTVSRYRKGGVGRRMVEMFRPS